MQIMPLMSKQFKYLRILQCRTNW